MDCSQPGSPVHGILRAGILKWVAIPFSRGSSWPRDRTRVSCIAGRFSTTEPPGKPTTGLWILTNSTSGHPLKSVPSYFCCICLAQTHHSPGRHLQEFPAIDCLPIYSAINSQVESFQNTHHSKSCSCLKPLMSTPAPSLTTTFPKTWDKDENILSSIWTNIFLLSCIDIYFHV